jgi:hypothetical protein
VSTKVGETTPAKPHLYGTSHMSGVEPVSRKSTRKVGRGQLSSNNTTDKTNTWKGDNYRLNAHTINMCSNRTNTSTHRSALIPLLGNGAENNNFSYQRNP